jgi:16S rRNA processing protein RimM
MSEAISAINRLPEFVIIGRINRPHGIRGEMKIEPMTDDPNRFNLLKSVFLRRDEDKGISFEIEHIREAGPRILLKMRGISTPEEAARWTGAYIEIPRSECLPLPDGMHYQFEIIGLEVKTRQGLLIGTIEDVIPYPANDVYLVKAGDKEILIPVIADVIDRIDTEEGVVVINPIEGLLD